METAVIRLGPDTISLRPAANRTQCRLWREDRHCNAEYELHLLLQGTCRLDVDEACHMLQAPQGILIAPGQYHRPWSQPGPFTRFSLSFSLSMGALAAELRQACPVCRVVAVRPETAALCEAYLREDEAVLPFASAQRQALLTQLMVGLLRQLALRDNPAVPQPAHSMAVRTDIIDHFFECCCGERTGAARLAEQLHLSVRQLQRVLRAEYGMGFQEKLMQARMDQAACLLRTTALSPSEVAAAVGYASESAFYQAFRMRFRLPPQAYRKTSQTE